MSPTVHATLRGRHAVVACPFCQAEHLHARHAGERDALCFRGRYVIELPEPAPLPTTTIELELQGEPVHVAGVLRLLLRRILRDRGIKCLGLRVVDTTTSATPAPSTAATSGTER